MVNKVRALEQLTLHEGVRTFYYLDTEDNWTLGIGYNVSSRGLGDFNRCVGRSLPEPDEGRVVITRDEANRMCLEDITRVERAVMVHFPFYSKLSEVRQRVVLDMAFNMGFKALGFKNTRAAVEREDWSTAVRELYKSKWARQLGDGPGGRFDRCERLACMLLTNKDYTK